MTFRDNLLKSFSENLKQLTKINDFLLFLCFLENRRIFHCFHARYEFCMQKYPSKCIFIDFPWKAQFRLIYQRLLPCDSADFLKNLKTFNFALFVFFSI